MPLPRTTPSLVNHPQSNRFTQSSTHKLDWSLEYLTKQQYVDLSGCGKASNERLTYTSIPGFDSGSVQPTETRALEQLDTRMR